MAEKITFESVSAFFFKVEKDEDLLNWKIAGVNVWVEFRTKLYYNFVIKRLELTGISEPKLHPYNPDFERTIASTEKYWKKIVRSKSKGPVTNFRPALMPFRRRNELGVDPLSIDVERNFPPNGLVFGVGRHDLANVEKPSFDRLKSLFWKRYRVPAALKVKLAFGLNHRKKLKRILSRFENEFNLELGDAVPKFEWFLRRFLAERWGFRRVFRYERLTHLFIVSADRPSVIAAAQDCGIEVIELQHGWMSSTHMRYSWPDTERVNYFPNQFWAWGEFWIENLSLPRSCRTQIMGATQAFAEMRDTQNTFIKNSVLAISQPFCSKRLLTYLTVLAEKIPEFTFLVKPHPTEQFTPEMLDKVKNIPNLSVSSSTESALSLISKSEYCVGVNSTSLFEALSLGKKVLLLPIEGSESLDRFLKSGECKLLDDFKEPKSCFEQAKPSGRPEYFYNTGSYLPELFASLSSTSAGQ